MFYVAEPHEYFWWRFYLLALAGDAAKDLPAFAKEGVTFAGFRIGPTPDMAEDDRDEEKEDKEAKRRYSFAVAEAVVLLHHVSETLLRLYFAHCEMPPSPWLEVARERQFARFKTRVRGRFVDDETTEADFEKVARLFFGSADRSKLGPTLDERPFREGIENIDRWLRFFASNFLDDAHLYNALKHGLAVNAGDWSASWADEP